MAINVLNRSGPISFSSLTLGSEKSAINSLISNFQDPGTENYSLSNSLAVLQQRVGNFETDTKTNDIVKPLGVGIINNDFKNPIKFSEFYGASFLSASILLGEDNDGTCNVVIYSPSTIVNNNLLTGNTSDQVFKYTLYTKDGTTTPFVDSGWTKVYSYAKSGDNNETFYNLVNTKTYKVVAKDCLSNAFTSSIFVGTCANTNNYKTSYSYNITGVNLTTTINSLKKQINADSANYTTTQMSDMESILNNFEKIIANPSSYRGTNSIFPQLIIKDVFGFNRTLQFDGLLFQRRQTQTGGLGYFFNGLVTCTSINGSSSPTQQYSFENTSTFGQIFFYILSSQTSTGTSCTTPPTTFVGNLPSNISFVGPQCGPLDCGTNKAQVDCNPSSTTQIIHTGSFTITNNNADIMSVNILNNWSDSNDAAPNVLLTPIVVNPSNFSIEANSFKKVSVSFGLTSYTNVNQPSNFILKTQAELSLPAKYTPSTRNCDVVATFDKNKCIISTKPPDNVPNDAECIIYNSLLTDTCASIKSNLSTRILNSAGTLTLNQKQLATYIVNAIPCTGCDLPTQVQLPSYLACSFYGYLPVNVKPSKNGPTVINQLFVYLKDSTAKYEAQFSELSPLPRTSTFSNGGIPTNGLPVTLDTNIVIFPRKTSAKVTVQILEQPTSANNYTVKILASKFNVTSDAETVRFTINASDTATFTWTLIPDGNRPYVCDNNKFSGTYNVTVSNTFLGTAKFLVEFLLDSAYTFLKGAGSINPGNGPKIATGKLNLQNNVIDFPNINDKYTLADWITVPLIKNFKPTSCVAPTFDLVLVGKNVTQEQLTTYGIQTSLNSLNKVNPGDKFSLSFVAYVNHYISLGFQVWDVSQTPSTDYKTYTNSYVEVYNSGTAAFGADRQYLNNVNLNKEFNVPQNFSNTSILVISFSDFIFNNPAVNGLNDLTVYLKPVSNSNYIKVCPA